MSTNPTALDVLAEVAGMVKQDKIHVKAGQHLSATLAWKDAEAYVRLWPVGDDMLGMWYIPRRDGMQSLLRHNYCIVGDSTQQMAAKVFAILQKDLHVR